MNKPKKNRDEVKTAHTTVLLSPPEMAELERHAYELGVSKSTFIRFALKEYLKKQED